MWSLGKIVPNFLRIADFCKDNAKAIKNIFRKFVVFCNKAGLLSHEAVMIDGSKFRAVNSDNNRCVENREWSQEIQLICLFTMRIGKLHFVVNKHL